MSNKNVPNLSINHIAVSVPNVENAIEWYSKVFGFEVMGGVQHYKRSELGRRGAFVLYPEEMNEVRVAFMTTGNGVGFELFQFVDPPTQEPTPFLYAQGGFFHIAVTDKDPAGLLKRVIANGGKQMGETVQLFEEEALYAMDPWGNVVEIISFSFDRFATRIAHGTTESMLKH